MIDSSSCTSLNDVESDTSSVTSVTVIQINDIKTLLKTLSELGYTNPG